MATAPESFARSSIVPQEGCVGSPRPTNASVDSARMVADTISTVLANTSGSTLGRMCCAHDPAAARRPAPARAR